MEQVNFEVLVTAEEAWPAFEMAVLSAKTEIVAGFRIFDMTTRLCGAEAREIGEDWFDLLAHALRRGVRVTLIVSDFDPLVGTRLHGIAWKTMRQGAALSEIAECAPGQLQVRADLHAARAGFLPWFSLLPATLSRKRDTVRKTRPDARKRQFPRLGSNWLPEISPVTHHQKLAVIDNEVLYLGGLDLNERRYDTPEHDRSAEETWSDVQLILRGPEAQDARTHLLTFEDATAGRIPVPSCPHLKRTMSVPRRFQMPFLSPRTVLCEIEDAHIKAFSSARHLVYIETQYMRSGAIADALIKAGQENTSLHVFFVLPALPSEVAFESSVSLDARYGMALQSDAVQGLLEAFGARICLSSPVRPIMADREAKYVLAGSPVIHVHNKVLLCDDDYGLVGSANLNGRSMRWDTEVALEITQPERLKVLQDKLFGHWWHDPLPNHAKDRATLFNWWRDEVTRNGLRLPENRTGFLVPYDPSNCADAFRPLPGVTEDVV